MLLRGIALLASLALALPAFSQSQLVVVLRGGRSQTFDLADVERIEFTGATSAFPGPVQPVYRDLVGTWDWVDGMTLVVDGNRTFALYRTDRTISSQGRWELLDASARRYRLTHARGNFVDTVAMSSDGWELSGTSNTGYRLQGRRRGVGTSSGVWQPGRSARDLFPGTYDWTDGQTLVIRADGSLEVLRGSRRTNDGTWQVLDAAAGRFRLEYRQGGWVDTVTLSADGREIDGTNNRGVRVYGTRR